MNSKLFYPLKIHKVIPKTKDAIAVTFEIPDEVQPIFRFQAGQYLTIRHKIDGEEVRRSYSICSAPFENDLTIAIKKLKGGKFSTFAHKNLKEGDVLEVMPPSGNFLCQYDAKKSMVFFAAGSGITPIIAHIKEILFHHPDISVTLFYGNQNFESIIFRKELEDLKNKFLERLAIHHIFSREKIGIPLLFGRIDREKCLKMHPLLFSVVDVDSFMLCGPNDMVFEVKEALMTLGAKPENIHFELFNANGVPSKSLQNQPLSPSDQHNHSNVTIKMDGDIFEFSLAYSGQSLLDAAVDNGADLPYSCKGGVCSTCKAKITHGLVEMDKNYALEPYELEAGFVLLCQAHPRTSTVFIDFDEK
jgi:ring-1,2-phenylacetyl-CoA epoxidase subunit PaaE